MIETKSNCFEKTDARRLLIFFLIKALTQIRTKYYALCHVLAVVLNLQFLFDFDSITANGECMASKPRTKL